MKTAKEKQPYSTSRARTVLAIVFLAYIFVLVFYLYDTINVVSLGFVLLSGVSALIAYGIIYYLLIWYERKKKP